MQIRTDGTPTTRASVAAIWGPKALEHLVDLDLAFAVEVDAALRRRLGRAQDDGWVLIASVDEYDSNREASETRTRSR